MLFSVASHKLEEFAAQIEDDSAGAAIEAAIRHEAYPGPVVCLIGAAGRGKSTLFDRMAGRAPSDNAPAGAEGSVRLAYGADWSGLAHQLVRSHGLDETVPVQRVDATPAGNILLIDTPALDTQTGRAVLPDILALSDLALMTVQVTNPAGQDEVAFAREYLGHTPAALVVTKADLADEFDFSEGLEAILTEYGALPWQAVLVSERSESGATAEGLQGLSGFAHWWRNEGPHCAAAALRQRRARLRQAWVAAARSVIERETAAVNEELVRLSGALQTNESLRHALELRGRIEQGLDSALRQAVGQYGARLRELQPRFMSCVEDCLVEDPPAMPDPSRITTTLQAMLKSGDQQIRDQLRQEMEPAITRLQQQHAEFIQSMGQLSADGAGALPARRENRAGPGGEPREPWFAALHVPHLDLTAAERARPGIAAALSGLGSAALLNGLAAVLLGPLALPIALLGGLASGWNIHGVTESANRRRLQADLRAGLLRQFPEVQQQLAERYRQDWESLRNGIAAQLAPYEQLLSLYQISISADNPSGLRPQYESLMKRKERYTALRRELAGLAASDASEEGVRDD